MTQPSVGAAGQDGAYQRGLTIRREVLGEDYVAKSTKAAAGFDSDFQRFITEYCWGTVWGRDGLPRHTRSLLNVAMLCALNRPHELALHVRGAFHNGCSLEQIEEAVFQVAVYCGIPAGIDGLRTVRMIAAEISKNSGAAQ